MKTITDTCPTCGKPQGKEEMWIIDSSCWQCDEVMKVAIIQSGSMMKRGGTTSGPESFSEDEIALAKSKGVIIEEIYSKTRDEKYLASKCACGAFAGQFYLFTEYLHPAMMGDYKYEKFEIGKYCFACETKEHLERESDEDEYDEDFFEEEE